MRYTGTAALLGDVHFPSQDDEALSAAYDRIEAEQPGLIVEMGDALDAYHLSQFNPDLRRAQTLQTEIDMGRAHFAHLRRICPKATIISLPGNHEKRLAKYLRTKAPALEGLRALRLDQLLGFDEQRIQAYSYPGFLLNEVRVKHGDMVRKGAGNSARAECEAAWRSVVIGHTHRLAAVSMRKDGRVYRAVETGCLCTLSPEYAAAPDWQQGFVLAEVSRGGLNDVECVEL